MITYTCNTIIQVMKSYFVISGDYSICIDNTHARFSTKLVYVYIVTFVMEELSKYVEEVTNINTAVVNFTVGPTRI